MTTYTTGCGPRRGIFSENPSTADIFDMLWKDCSELILSTSQAREHEDFDIEDINLFLASTLVMGLAPQPTIEDYFVQDPTGIFGNLWMQQHFTKPTWSKLHSFIHIDHHSLIQQVRSNAQDIWMLHQRLVIDEMMIPFQGKWKFRQCVKGKPHNTGIHTLTEF